MLLHIALTKWADEQKNALFAAMTVLQVMETNAGIMLDVGWRRYTDRARYLLRDRHGDECRPEFLQLLDANFRMFHFWDALIARKRVDDFFRGDITVLNGIAQRVLDALEECDVACRQGRKHTVERATEATNMLKGIEADLNARSIRWARCITDGWEALDHLR